MRRLFAALCCVLIAGVALADEFLDRPAPLEKLKPAEVRFLQALMAVENTYDGLTDGVWGGRSLNGFRALMQKKRGTDAASIRDLASLSAPFQAALTGGQWKPLHDKTSNMSFQIPHEVMYAQPGQDEFAAIAYDGNIILRARLGSIEEAQQAHDWVGANSNRPDAVANVSESQIAVTSAVFNDATNTAYVRSQKHGQKIATVLVQWRPQRAAEARLIIASITKGKQRPLDLPDGGVIARAIRAAQEQPLVQTEPPQTPETELTGQSGSYAGTGFYINNTDLVTAAAVLRRCQGLTLGDGTSLSTVENGRGMGAAVLTSERRSRHWLALAAQDLPTMNTPLSALGYPFYTKSYRGLTGTSGTMQGRAGGENAGKRLALSMPRRPGNMGAPVLDGDNRVVAVVVDRANEDREALAQKVTLAAPMQAFTGFLNRNGIAHDTGAPKALNSAQKLQHSDGARAIVPLFCR